MRPLRSPQDEAWNMLVDHSPRSISDLLSEPTLKELMLHHVRTHLLPRTTRHNGNTRVYAHSSGAAYVLRQAACLRRLVVQKPAEAQRRPRACGAYADRLWRVGCEDALFAGKPSPGRLPGCSHQLGDGGAPDAGRAAHGRVIFRAGELLRRRPFLLRLQLQI